MSKFRLKPVAIEATQFWNDKHFPKDVCDCTVDVQHFGTPHVHTTMGILDVSEGDWIATRPDGAPDVVAPEVFEAIFVAVTLERMPRRY